MTLILLLLCTSLHAQFAALYKPEGEPKAAVIVCPGGSYFWLDKELLPMCFIIARRDGLISHSEPGPCSAGTVIRI